MFLSLAFNIPACLLLVVLINCEVVHNGCLSPFSSVVGELDEELDSNLDLSRLRAHPLKAVIH